MWKAFNTKKGRWVEGWINYHIRVDAYMFDKVMVDKWGNKIKRAFPFEEISYRVKTGKQFVWLNKEQVNDIVKAVNELEQSVKSRMTEKEEIELAVREAQKGKIR